MIKRRPQVSIRDHRSAVKHPLRSDAHLSFLLKILNIIHISSIFDNLLSEVQHSSNIYTFRNGSCLNNEIHRLREYFNDFVRSSISFPILILLAITYNYFVSFEVLMENYLLILSLIILLIFLPYHPPIGDIADIKYNISSKD